MPYPHPPGGSPGELPIDMLRIRQAALIVRALEHPLQRRLLQIIYRKGAVCVTGLYTELDLEQAITSFHLAELREAGLVTVTKEGATCMYSVNDQRLKSIQFLIKALRNTTL